MKTILLEENEDVAPCFGTYKAVILAIGGRQGGSDFCMNLLLNFCAAGHTSSVTFTLLDITAACQRTFLVALARSLLHWLNHSYYSNDFSCWLSQTHAHRPLQVPRLTLPIVQPVQILLHLLWRPLAWHCSCASASILLHWLSHFCIGSVTLTCTGIPMCCTCHSFVLPGLLRNHLYK